MKRTLTNNIRFLYVSSIRPSVTGTSITYRFPCSIARMKENKCLDNMIYYLINLIRNVFSFILRWHTRIGWKNSFHSVTMRRGPVKYTSTCIYYSPWTYKFITLCENYKWNLFWICSFCILPISMYHSIKQITRRIYNLLFICLHVVSFFSEHCT